MATNPSSGHAAEDKAPQTTRAWRKAIPAGRDRSQSAALTTLVSALLLWEAFRLTVANTKLHHITPWPLLVSLAFALTVWWLRAATAPAAATGALICFLLATPGVGAHYVLAPALLPLAGLFLLTFAATRFKRRVKEAAGLAEARQGRRASQIVANLGVAGICAALGFYPGTLAALAEATADTLSSEVGQALGGPTWLFPSLRRVEPGTDGGISLAGTAAGLIGSALLVLSGAAWLPTLQSAGIVLLASIAGLLFDSLLGTTIERRGWIGNDLVNFGSTFFAVALSWVALLR